jgi:hypothetical protein
MKAKTSKWLRLETQKNTSNLAPNLKNLRFIKQSLSAKKVTISCLQCVVMALDKKEVGKRRP